MAARTGTNNTYMLARNVYTIVGKCVGNGVSNPTALKGKGIATVTRTALGKYTITLNDKWAALLSVDLTFIDSTGANQFTYNVVSETVASTKTINISVFSSATAVAPGLADLATTTTMKMCIMLSNSAQIPLDF